jgi:hypothetical protein
MVFYYLFLNGLKLNFLLIINKYGGFRLFAVGFKINSRFKRKGPRSSATVGLN